MYQTQAPELRDLKVQESLAANKGASLILEAENIPSSPRERAILRKQLLRDISAAKQEAEFLQFSGDADRSTSERLRGGILRRLSAMNPFRNFDKVGASWINDGINPWRAPERESSVILIGLGALSAVGLPIAAWAITHSLAIAGAAAAFGLAPAFLVTWGARTVFNLVVGAPVAAASPLFFGIAKLLDKVRPGELAGARYLRELRERFSDRYKVKREKEDRVAELKEDIREKEEQLAVITCGRKFSRDEIRQRWLEEAAPGNGGGNAAG